MILFTCVINHHVSMRESSYSYRDIVVSIKQVAAIASPILDSCKTYKCPDHHGRIVSSKEMPH
jgi:hypothetical protein